MSGIARMGDLVSCICCCHSDPTCRSTIGVFVTGSPDAKVNGSGAVTVGDIAMCDCGHPTMVASGAPSSFANSISMGRIGDTVSACPVGTIITGSEDSIAN